MIAFLEARRSALLGWLSRGALIVNVALALSYVVLWATLARDGAFWQADFTAFYTGWSIVREGRGAELYDLDLQAQVQREILEGRSFADGLLPYLNPPHAAILFAPLARLPRQRAFAAWTSGQVLLLLWLVRLLGRMASGWTPRERRSMASALLAFPPLFYTFELGTFSLLMVVCVLQACLALKDERDGLAGLWIALGTLKPQAVLLPGLMLLAARRWRAVLSAASAVLVIGVTSTALLKPGIWLAYLHVIDTASSFYGSYGVSPAEMYNLKGALTRCLGPDHARMINALSGGALAAAVVATLGIWRAAGNSDVPGFELRMSLTILLGIVCSPHLYPHDSLMLVAPVALLYAVSQDHRSHRELCAGFITSCPLLFVIAESGIGRRLAIGLPVLVMLVFVGWTVTGLSGRRPVTGVVRRRGLE